MTRVIGPALRRRGKGQLPRRRTRPSRGSTLLPVASAAGLDVPWPVFEFFVGGRSEFARGYTENVGSRGWFGETAWTGKLVRGCGRGSANHHRLRPEGRPASGGRHAAFDSSFRRIADSIAPVVALLREERRDKRERGANP
jgi:hypothetical protein